jgi:hypothetical protein
LIGEALPQFVLSRWGCVSTFISVRLRSKIRAGPGRRRCLIEHVERSKYLLTDITDPPDMKKPLSPVKDRGGFFWSSGPSGLGTTATDDLRTFQHVLRQDSV